MKHIKLYENFNSPKIVVEGSYSPRPGDYDGMHSFQSRKKDGFGGKMNTKVNAALLKFYTEYKLNPEITKIEIKMDDSAWKVMWRVTIEESRDGQAWMGLTSRGGAGRKDGPSGSVKRAEYQIEKKKRDLKSELQDPNMKTKVVHDLGWQGKGAYIRQIFINFTNPKKYPPHQKDSDFSTFMPFS